MTMRFSSTTQDCSQQKKLGGKHTVVVGGRKLRMAGVRGVFFVGLVRRIVVFLVGICW